MMKLAIIPARSGSKGLKDKNIKSLCGKPLLQYTVEAAYQSGIFDEIMVSTDSELYKRIALDCKAKVPFLRSPKMASDSAGSWDMAREVLENYKSMGVDFDFVTLLQPTSPLRTAADIVNAYEIFCGKKASAVVAVCEAEHPPYWYHVLPESGIMEDFLNMELIQTPRQELPVYYRINGAIYMRRPDDIVRDAKLYSAGCYAYKMPAERSVDIDSMVDFCIVEALMNLTNQKER